MGGYTVSLHFAPQTENFFPGKKQVAGDNRNIGKVSKTDSASKWE